MIVPSSVTLDAQALHYAPVLQAVGRVNAGAENIDLEACARAEVEVVRSATATAQAEAEFMIGALLSLLRRVPVAGSDGVPVGRELGSATVGLVGMAPAARSMVDLLGGFGSRVVGYDPSLHASDPVWERWQVAPLSLRELLMQSDARLRPAQLLQPLPRPARRALPVVLQARTRCWSAPRTPGLFDESRARRRADRAVASPPPGSTAWSRARSTKAGRCTASRPCRSRRGWPARRASRARAAPGRWRGASTRS